MEIGTLLTIIVALPLLSAVVTAVLGPKVLRAYSHVPTVLALLGAFVCAALLLWQAVPSFAQQSSGQEPASPARPQERYG